MITTFTQPFRKPDADELAQRELEDSRRELMVAQRMRDYYIKMVEFHEMRVASLRRYPQGD